ncbi:MAG: helix-turn-helix transcriptional regulator [Deltaproteobacteria bacterium]|nr:helix-turn-helix transcriptional regulator [Deltaproteobacteria bacterium]
MLRGLGARARQLRTLRELAQGELATRAGVGVATVQRFERTGRAAMESVVRIAIALRAEAVFERLFEAPAYRSLDEAFARTYATRTPGKRRRKAP